MNYTTNTPLQKKEEKIAKVGKLIQIKKEIQEYKNSVEVQTNQTKNNKNHEQQRKYSKITTQQNEEAIAQLKEQQKGLTADVQVLQQQIQLHHQKEEIKHIVEEEEKKKKKKVEYKPDKGQPVIMSGKKLSMKIKNDLKKRIKEDEKLVKKVPGLALIMVGTKKNSQSYINTKKKTSEQLGMKSKIHKLPEETTTEEIIKVVKELNKNDDTHGIVVQLPLPKHINTDDVIHAIDPQKDVDMFQSNSSATAFGVRDLLEYYYCQGDLEEGYRSIAGKHVVVVGRSQYVGRPIADLFLNEDNCTVTVVHERTPEERRKELTKAGDIVILVCGVSQMVRGEDIKEGAIVIDVGVNEVWEETDDTKETTKRIRRITGDCHYDECAVIADFITPVPGGVGPMTIMRLMQNTYAAYRSLENVDGAELKKKMNEIHAATSLSSSSTTCQPIISPSTTLTPAQHF